MSTLPFWPFWDNPVQGVASYPPSPKVEIAFATAPLAATPVWTDVTAYVKQLSTRRGRSHELNRVDAGTATLTLDNADRRFDPLNTVSPYAPNVLPLRKCRLSMFDGVTTYYLFTGYIERWPMPWQDGGLDSDMTVTLVDGSDFLGATNLVTAHASLTTSLGGNADLTFTAVGGGVDGNSIGIIYYVRQRGPGKSVQIYFSPNSPVTVSDHLNGDVTVPPMVALIAMESQEAIPPTVLTTASQVRDAVNSHATLSQYLYATLAPGSDGTGTVNSIPLTYLSGGTYAQELSGTRIGHILDAAGWPAADRAIDTGQHQVTGAFFDLAARQKALQHAQDTAETEGGYFFFSASGTPSFHDAAHRTLTATSRVAQATFGDGAGELGYESLTPSYDRDNIRNDITVTTPSGLTGVSADATSISQYGDREYQPSAANQVSQNEAQGAADYYLYRYSNPQLRFEKITIRPMADSALWPAVLARDFGDRITVKRRPPEHPTVGGPVITQDCYIEGIEVQAAPPLDFLWTFVLSPALDLFWILGDSTYGVLETTARLGR
jgi:hypothetical protein